MPKAKTDKKTTKAVVETAPAKKATPKKPAPVRKQKPSKASEPVITYPQPDEIVPGRFYEVCMTEGRIYGELISVDGDLQTLDVWESGKPTGHQTAKWFANRAVREVSREMCFDLSRL